MFHPSLLAGLRAFPLFLVGESCFGSRRYERTHILLYFSILVLSPCPQCFWSPCSWSVTSTPEERRTLEPLPLIRTSWGTSEEKRERRDVESINERYEKRKKNGEKINNNLVTILRRKAKNGGKMSVGIRQTFPHARDFGRRYSSSNIKMRLLVLLHEYHRLVFMLVANVFCGSGKKKKKLVPIQLPSFALLLFPVIRLVMKNVLLPKEKKRKKRRERRGRKGGKKGKEKEKEKEIERKKERKREE